MTNNKRGFTLIELMVVVLIVMVMTAVVVVSLTNSRRSGRDARRISDINIVTAALQLYYADNKTYPPSGFNTIAGSSGSLVSSRYLDAAITPNPYPDSSYSCNPYFYVFDSVNMIYRLYFAPEDIDKNANCTDCAKDTTTPATCPATGLYLIKNGQASTAW